MRVSTLARASPPTLIYSSELPILILIENLFGITINKSSVLKDSDTVSYNQTIVIPDSSQHSESSQSTYSTEHSQKSEDGGDIKCSNTSHNQWQ